MVSRSRATFQTKRPFFKFVPDFKMAPKKRGWNETAFKALFNLQKLNDDERRQIYKAATAMLEAEGYGCLGPSTSNGHTSNESSADGNFDTKPEVILPRDIGLGLVAELDFKVEYEDENEGPSNLQDLLKQLSPKEIMYRDQSIRKRVKSFILNLNGDNHYISTNDPMMLKTTPKSPNCLNEIRDQDRYKDTYEMYHLEGMKFVTGRRMRTPDPSRVPSEEQILHNKFIAYQVCNEALNLPDPVKSLLFASGEFEFGKNRPGQKKLMRVYDVLDGTTKVMAQRQGAGMRERLLKPIKKAYNIVITTITLSTVITSLILGSILNWHNFGCVGPVGRVICPFIWPHANNATFLCLDEDNDLVAYHTSDYLYCHDLLENYGAYDLNMSGESSPHLGKRTVKNLQVFAKPGKKLSARLREKLKATLKKIKEVQDASGRQCFCRGNGFLNNVERVSCEVFIKHLEADFKDKIPRPKWGFRF